MYKLIASTEVTTSTGEKKTLYARKRIIVRYPGLVRLTNDLLGANLIKFSFTSGNMYHKGEYVEYVNSKVLDRVKVFLKEFANLHWWEIVKDNSIKGASKLLMLNDISLPMGGILKFLGSENDITKYFEHLSHRRGTGMDINHFVCISGTNSHYHQDSCPDGYYAVWFKSQQRDERVKKKVNWICKTYHLNCHFVKEGAKSLHVEFDLEE